MTDDWSLAGGGMMVDQPRPVAILEFGPVYKLTQEQWRSLRLRLLRYFTWVDSGRLADPWASGVASASRFGPRVKSSRPAGYDAGRAAEPEIDPTLVEFDLRMLALPDHDRLLARWHVHDGLTIDGCAERLQVSADTVADRWRRLGVRLYYRLA